MAMKVFKKSAIRESGLLNQFIRELKIQTYLDHPNIVKIYVCFDDETHFYTLLELGCDGQLYSLMTSNKITT